MTTYSVDGWTLVLIIALAIITVITRCFFFISDHELRLPRWVQRGLQYAPIAALAAVIAPDIVMTQGHVINPITDARLWGALATVVFYVRQRERSYAMVGAIAAGMVVYLPLHLAFGG